MVLYLCFMLFPDAHSFINIHTHFKPRVPGEFVIRNAYDLLDTARLQQLPYALSIGLHPWYTQKKKLFELNSYLQKNITLPNVLALGEAGIDRAISTDAALQQAYFEAQLHLAEAWKKPMIIHAVKSYSDFLPLAKKARVPFIFHQFNGNLQQAMQLVEYGCKLSFGKNLFREKVADVLQHLPHGSFFLETDNAPHLLITQVYEEAARLRKIKTESLKAELFYTFAGIFEKQK